MENSSVLIKNLTSTQANLIGILFEDGDMLDFLNEKSHEKFKGAVDVFDDCSVEYDESESMPSHVVIIK